MSEYEMRPSPIESLRRELDAWQQRAESAERERDAALATLASEPDRITTTGDNEITAYPWWGVVDPRRGCDGVIGPFFSRKSAEEHLTHKGHRYGKKARVFCFSGHESSDYRAIHRHVGSALKGPVTP